MKLKFSSVASVLLSVLVAGGATSDTLAAGEKTLNRDMEPVVVVVDEYNVAFSPFIGQPADRIHLYRYDPTHPNNFVPIPFQIDRKREWTLHNNCSPVLDLVDNCELGHDFNDQTGEYQSGPLRHRDEIVFLARDSGPQALDLEVWHPGNVATSRLEIKAYEASAESAAPESEAGIEGSGWVYAFLFLEDHDFELGSDGYYVGWEPRVAADPDRPDESCIAGDPHPNRGAKACGLFKGLGDRFDATTYQLRFTGHWIRSRLFVVPSGQSDPSGELIDRIKTREASDTEDEETWSQADAVYNCACFLGLRVGPVRVVRYVQGADSGLTTTSVDYLYPTHFHTQVRLRVHRGAGDVDWFLDYLESTSDSAIYVESDVTGGPADTINGEWEGSFPGQWEDWTQVNTALARLVHVFKETRTLQTASRAYHYMDDAGEEREPEFEVGSYGNHGPTWPDTFQNMQDEECDPVDPEFPLGLWAQVDFTTFVASPSTLSPSEDRLVFFDWAENPVRSAAIGQQRVTPMPSPGSPSCPPTLATSYNPEDGTRLDVGASIEGCSDSSVGFSIYRAVGFGAFKHLGLAWPGEHLMDFNVHLGQTYRYFARGANSEGVEGPSSPVLSMVVVDNVPPDPPTQLAVSSGDGAITVTWQAPAGGALGYDAYLSTTPGGPHTKANPSLIPHDRTTFTVSSLQGGVPYYLVLRSVDVAGNESVDSEEVSGTPGP
jgi:hypothetical protein